MARSVSWTKAMVLVVLGIATGWVIPSQQTSNAKPVCRVEPPRIGYVNLSLVLQRFELANQYEAKIADSRAVHDEKIIAERDVLSQLNMHYQASDDPVRKKELQDQALAVQRRIETIDKEATNELDVLTNNKHVAVYEQVREIIAELAKDRGLDVVEAFPSAATPREERSPKVAQLTLQTPALIPLYLNPELDFTAEVIARLNKKFPPETGNKPAD